MDISPELRDFGWCPFARVVGEPCILCGGTRALVSLCTGDVGTALKMNGAVVLMLAAVAIRVAWLSVTRFGSLQTSGLRISWSARHRPRLLLAEASVFAIWWFWNIGRW